MFRPGQKISKIRKSETVVIVKNIHWQETYLNRLVYSQSLSVIWINGRKNSFFTIKRGQMGGFFYLFKIFTNEIIIELLHSKRMILQVRKLHMLSHEKSHKCFNTSIVVTVNLAKEVEFFFEIWVIVVNEG